jgi:hypothetical protein
MASTDVWPCLEVETVEVVLDVADVISSRLGEPTVTALARRFGPEGKCLTCGARFGDAPLSVRAYRGDEETVTLVAYHSACANSAWLDVGSATLPRGSTWVAAIVGASIRVATRRPVRWLRGPRAVDQTLPVMVVHPGLEVTRVRQVGSGEAVNADLEYFHGLGFTDSHALATSYPAPVVGLSHLDRYGQAISLIVRVDGQIWTAPVRERRLTGLVAGSRGALVGVTFDRDPARLSANARYLESAIGNGEVLLGWAALADDQRDAG